VTGDNYRFRLRDKIFSSVSSEINLVATHPRKIIVSVITLLSEIIRDVPNHDGQESGSGQQHKPKPWIIMGPSRA
jgi:hypothetical protein